MGVEALGRLRGLESWLQWGIQELAFLGEREAREECEQILESLFQVSRPELYLTLHLNREAFHEFSRIVETRKERIPLGFLLKRVPFWEEELEVEEGVFIPRPETEILIEAFVESGEFARTDSFRFLDVGTGSGNIAVTIAKLFPSSQGVGSDLSMEALQCARRNSERLKVRERIEWIHSFGLEAFKKEGFDAVFSNPPYVASADWEGLEPEVQKEPRLALDGGKDGLDFYRKILRDTACLKPGGHLWVEVGWNQSTQVESLFRENGFGFIRNFKDLNQIERVVSGVKLNG